MTNRIVRFPIGQQFMSGGKHPRLCTVIDILKTFNNAGDLVRISYVAEHEFLGQKVTSWDNCDTTVARGAMDLDRLKQKEKYRV